MEIGPLGLTRKGTRSQLLTMLWLHPRLPEGISRVLGRQSLVEGAAAVSFCDCIYTCHLKNTLLLCMVVGQCSRSMYFAQAMKLLVLNLILVKPTPSLPSTSD